MLNIEKYGAVDIGSNAIRLLVVTVIEQEGKDPIFKKTSLVRVPIRLGAEVFLDGKISDGNAARMIDAMSAFRLLMNTHGIKRYRACATSAMREASNGTHIADVIKKESGIVINIIDGKDEAKIIASTDLKTLIQDDKVFLYVDVGGGSTELTVFANGKNVCSKSFKIGTVRLLEGLVDESVWNEMKTWIKSETKDFKKLSMIGSGGNINTIFKKSGKKLGKPLSYIYLSSYYKKLEYLSYEERITELDMNPDRADVVVPATKIYLSAMKWSKAKNVFVPKIGLSDGIIKSLYNEKVAAEITNNE
ncbi:Ppx/GppA phosphatase family protein [Aequorivita viscosa]|uniref:Exopolyphosphatase / guanosine-5'-triphosphate,3'-diphosphate pyrophosphatase n=1 Tax=Aequorivita viscosa TaxID=797419 RepID=A0A1M6F649_9FLAO|nr:exopolyphosphatase [Aequorivita viscosa]SDW65371.1 exopolyphosphatase / guanosine-5'-triphosphate,3'-diphosphate pyrophosphatase [Aequorivita viscosa]SHI93151.1 exopolyphosphatase / guanosine-5'-triphosphate,3'-diphosphate pyrophosphatase [Aequorivita viscosa]